MFFPFSPFRPPTLDGRIMAEQGRYQPRIIATPGYPLILAAVVLIFLGWIGHWPWITVLGLAGGGFFTYFFRDPDRPIPADPGAVVAPADGKVIRVEEVQEPQFLHGPARRVAIFMDVFDVHVNRAPVAGVVKEMLHRPGSYRAAFRPEAAQQNEQQTLVLEAGAGRRLLVVQIAGLLARRIVPFVQPGQHLARGERLGMICFGSRVDLYLPPEAEIVVQVGAKVKAGSTILAQWWLDAA
jgi:phosphatidylserine decarboxylase